MLHRQLNKIFISTLLGSFIGPVSALVATDLEITQTYNLPAQSLELALRKIAAQDDLQIIFSSADLSGVQSASLQGEFKPLQAIDQLLKGTGLIYSFNDNDTVVVRKALVTEESSETGGTNGGSVEKSNQRVIEEITITASKREQSLQDASMSVSAIQAQDIERKNLLNMDDYLRTVPGVNMIDSGPGRNTIIMRGITLDPQLEGKTVGAYFGEIPTGGISRRYNDGGSTDFTMVDIARVEVLRGPQGTLYGSGSMGGAVRVIPNSPDLNTLEGSIQGGYSSTARNGGLSNHIEGVFNIPLIEDKLALRMVGYRFDTSGTIRNVVETSKAQAIADSGAIGKNEDDIGANNTKGFRGSLLWRVTDALDVEILYVQQDSSVNGRPDVDLTLGDYEQDRYVTPFGDENIEDEVSASNIQVRYDFGWSSLTSSSSWTHTTGLSNRNFGGGFWEVTPVSQQLLSDVNTFTQEIRLASSLDGPFQFVTGVYYEDMNVERSINNAWGGSLDLQEEYGFGVGQSLGTFNAPENINQQAVFGELTYEITSQLSVTGGVRLFEYDTDRRTTTATPGFFSGYAYYDSGLLESDEKEDSYKFNISYNINEDQLIYAQWSQGFRLGYPIAKAAPGSACDLNGDGIHDDLGLPYPKQIDSDYLENTEVGIKLSALDNRFTLNASAYSIDWQGLPVTLGYAGTTPCGGGITVNAGKARSVGFELESSYYATDNLRVDFGASLTNAELRTDVLGFADSGDRLPGMPKHAFNIGVQYDFIVATYEAYLQSNISYVGGFYGNVKQTGAKAGDYYQVNLKSGVNLGSVGVNMFVNNLINSNALTWVDLFDPSAYRVKPRTIGFNLIYNF